MKSWQNREKVKCNLVPSLRRYWKLPEEGDIYGHLLHVGQEMDGNEPYVCAFVILDDGRVIGVNPTDLVFVDRDLRASRFESYKNVD